MMLQIMQENETPLIVDNIQGNIIQASSKFAQRRMNETYGWTPGLQLRKKLVDLAMGGGASRT